MAPAAELLFPEELFGRIIEFSEAAYPHEGCGVLVGTPNSGGAVVSQVLQGRNLVTERRHDRYELDPRDIIQAERLAREIGQEVIGFYHTHPDHPARPSQFDTDRAWSGYHYVVVAVQAGRTVEATAWRLAEGEQPNRFEPVPLKGGLASPGYNPPSLVAEAP